MSNSMQQGRAQRPEQILTVPDVSGHISWTEEANHNQKDFNTRQLERVRDSLRRQNGAWRSAAHYSSPQARVMPALTGPVSERLLDSMRRIRPD